VPLGSAKPRLEGRGFCLGSRFGNRLNMWIRRSLNTVDGVQNEGKTLFWLWFLLPESHIVTGNKIEKG
jgi:hypothetical protein